MPSSRPSKLARVALAAALAVSGAVVTSAATLVAATTAAAVTAGPPVDGYQPYVAATNCQDSYYAKPGVVEFKDMLLARMGGSNGGIVACSGYEHMEGRALDWMNNASVPADAARVQKVLDWMLATDADGNAHAMARRLGIAYIIWNGRVINMYGADKSWQTYSCDGSPGGCHTNHVHFAFSWAGANRQTTWFTTNPRPANWYPDAAGQPTERVGVLTADGTLMVKEGALDGGWRTMTGPGVVQYDLTGDRVAVRYADGRIHVKEGSLDGAWTDMGVHGSSMALAGDRVAYLSAQDGQVRVKQGPLNGAWVSLGVPAASFKMSPNRIALKLSDGRVTVKEGALDAGWADMGLYVSGDHYQVTDNRFALINPSDNQVTVKEGALNSGWTTMGIYGKEFDMSPNRIAVQLADGQVKVKQGALNSGWTDMGLYGAQFDVTDTRFALLNTYNQQVTVKEGALGNSWTTMGLQGASFALSHS